MALLFTNASHWLIEIGQNSLRMVTGEDGRELPLERQPNGRLTPACKERLSVALRSFLKSRGAFGQQRAFCAINARGVSLRRLALPRSAKNDFDRLLALQIEKEFPLSPDELAWGCRPIDPEGSRPPEATENQELIVVALKREALEEYAEMFSGCGLNPVFTLGALARSETSPPQTGSFAWIEIGRTHSELIALEQGAPVTLRIVPWGGENLTRAIETQLNVSRDQAEQWKLDAESVSPALGGSGAAVQSAMRDEMRTLAKSIRNHWTGRKLILSGKTVRNPGFAKWLSEALGDGTECESREYSGKEGHSAAILGLKRYVEKDGSCPPLIIETRKTKSAVESFAEPARWRWVALAASLAIASLALRYAEPVLRAPQLAKRLTEIKSARNGLPVIDQELGFLEYLSTNQTPFLDTFLVLANAAAPGMRIDSFSLNRSGDLSIRATMQVTQAAEFRTKLIESGFFSTVVVDEQAPSPDRRSAVVRISAQVKPPRSRPTPPVTSLPARGPGMSMPPGGGAMPAFGPEGMPFSSMPSPMPGMPSSVPVAPNGTPSMPPPQGTAPARQGMPARVMTMPSPPPEMSAPPPEIKN